jgi:hypothetical protein
VARDVRNGLVSRANARDVYAVALDEAGDVDAGGDGGAARGEGVVTRLVGVDVGGTFTDLAFFDEASGRFSTAKVPSNRGDEAVGFIEGLRKGGPIASLEAIVHGTTVGTNALLERKGARIGLITTPAFATRWRCAGATGRTPGACGAISRRSPSARCDSKFPSARSPTGRSARRSISTRCAPPAPS